MAPKAGSCTSGYFYLSNHPRRTQTPSLNGAILVECKTLRHVVSSAAEAETAGGFHNTQMAIPIRRILGFLGHPQPATPFQTDNTTATVFLHNNIHQKCSKSWDMRYYWLRQNKQKTNSSSFGYRDKIIILTTLQSIISRKITWK